MQTKWVLVAGALLTAIVGGQARAQGRNLNVNLPVRPESRVIGPVDRSRRVTLPGNVHPLARAEFDRGSVAPGMAMSRMVLVLKRSDEQEAALQSFMAEQQNPKSPDFHHWLSAAEFGATFGISDQDLAKVTGWLQGEGFSVDTISQGRGTIEFSGTASQVQRSFQTEIHRYVVNGVEHTANDRNPQIPSALAPVIHGIASLHTFYPVSQAVLGRHVARDTKTGKVTSTDSPAAASRAVSPQFTYTGSAQQEDVTPYDFATVYNVLPLWDAGIKGAGQTIAISGVSTISLADVAAFQSSFGLPNNPPTIILNGNPSTTSAAVENTLDVEWSGAVAPQAKIVLVVSPSTSATSGDLLSNEYIVNNQIASIMSTSFGTCELYMGTAGNAAYNQVWQQGAAEGISIFVAAGDQGSAGCENHDASAPNASQTGLQVSGVASSPYVTAVGGTDFNWQFAPANTYWNSTNDPTTGASAKGYIPELPWNQSCASSFLGAFFTGETPAEKLCNDALNSSTYESLVVTVGGSGGVSGCTTSDGTTTASCTGGYAKPVWQTGPGVPNDSHRDIPDVSLFAADGFPEFIPGSAYLICYSSANHPCGNAANSATAIEYQETGGTSVSSPAMAGIMALVNQQVGAAQGLANPVLYQLFNAETSVPSCNSNTVGSGNSCVFYDTTSGNNSTPCIPSSLNCVTNTSGDQLGVLSGYNTTAGYDLGTGLGSVNAANLVAAWKAVAVLPVPPVITVAPQTVPSGLVGAAYSQQFTATATGTATYPLTFSATGLPPGLSMSSSGLLSGIPTTANTYVVQVIATDSSNANAGGPFSGSMEVSLLIHAAGSNVVPVITWNPTHTTVFVHGQIGGGVLDATASVPGAFAYTATLGTQTPVPITATSELAQQNYTFTANFTPADETDYTEASAAIAVSVVPQNVFVTNSTGSISLLYPDGMAINSSPSPGGGIGIALGETDTISSISTSGTALNTISYTGSAQASITGGGLVSGTAVAADSEGIFWMTNSNGSISEYIANFPAISPSTGFTGGGMNNPSSIAIDLAGNLWIANKGNNSVTEVLGVANPTAPIVNELKTQGRP